MKLTEPQREVLEAMNAGHVMVFSQDGEMAWLSPKHTTGFLSDEQTCGLRQLGLIEGQPGEHELVRYGPPDVISEAGRQALKGGGE